MIALFVACVCSDLDLDDDDVDDDEEKALIAEQAEWYYRENDCAT